MTEDFVKAVKDMPKVCRHYHLSLQSGHDETLKRMNRKYNTKQYREIVDTLRKYIPDVAITTDIMVGFPGETQEEFEETIEFVKRLDLVGFMYLSIPLEKEHQQPDSKIKFQKI